MLIICSLSITAQDPEWDDLSPNLNDSEKYKMVKDSSNNKVFEHYYLRATAKRINWIIVKEFDANGNIIKDYYTDTLFKFKEAIICGSPLTRRRYNAKNQLIEVSHFKNHETAAIHDCAHYHKMTLSYDKRGFVNSKIYYYVGDKFNIRIDFKNNKAGKEIQVKYLNEQGKLIKDDRAIIDIKYDEKGRDIKHSFRDENGKPVKDKKKTSYITYEYGEGYKITKEYNYKGELLHESESGKRALEKILKSFEE